MKTRVVCMYICVALDMCAIYLAGHSYVCHTYAYLICATLDKCAIYITESFIRVPYIEWVIITWIWVLHMSLYMCAIYVTSHLYVCHILYMCVTLDMCAICITRLSYVCHVYVYLCGTWYVCHVYNRIIYRCAIYRTSHYYLNLNYSYDTWYVCRIYHESSIRVTYICISVRHLICVPYI